MNLITLFYRTNLIKSGLVLFFILNLFRCVPDNSESQSEAETEESNSAQVQINKTKDTLSADTAKTDSFDVVQKMADTLGITRDEFVKNRESYLSPGFIKKHPEIQEILFEFIYDTNDQDSIK